MANPKDTPNLAGGLGSSLAGNSAVADAIREAALKPDLGVKPDLKLKPDGPAPAPPAEPDPSRVYGYITLVDPSTGATHLPLDPDDPNVVQGAPNGLTLTFRAPGGAAHEYGAAHLQTVRREANGTLAYLHPSNAGFAWYYDIQLNADRTEGAPRDGGPSGLAISPLRTDVVSYNPDQWRFESVSVGFVSIPDPNGNTFEGPNRFNRIPLAKRDAPFADFPDTV
jgi:hypothetical protein